MSNPIPPLVCNTPPPIDFDAPDNDDDFGGFESHEGPFNSFEVSSLPSSPRNANSDIDFSVPDTTEDERISKIHEKPPLLNEFTKIETNNNLNESSKSDLTQVTEVNCCIIEKPKEENLVNNVTSEISISEQVITKNETTTSENTDFNPIDKIININNDDDNNLKAADAINYSEDDEIDKAIDQSGLSAEQRHEEYNYRGESPPSLILSDYGLVVDETEPPPDDFNYYEDNTSLTSLHFDSGNISTSNTPTFNNNNLPDAIIKTSPVSVLEHEQYAVEISGTSRNEPLEEDDKEISKSSDELDEFSSYSAVQPQSIENELSDTNLEDTHNHLEHNKINEDDDDFAEFTSATIVEPKSLVFDKDNDFQSFNVHSQNEFVADFSQFASFPDNNEVPELKVVDIQSNETVENLPSSSIISNDKDDDDFDDFHDYTTQITNKENDDDFGEFNDFQQITNSTTASIVPAPIVLNSSLLNSKFTSTLNMMFPQSGESTDDDLVHKSELSIDDKVVLTDLKDFESAKALEYQWQNSSSNQSLITSLGIDSRNILFGGKWNSSMPRFAANLGFSPLQPMKSGNSTTSLASSTIALPSTLVTASNNLSTSAATGNDSGSSVTTTNDVPAVQFDWNSAGLVNPLDASHAHTLLLDLEQLVVVANLDKIKLDSSSPCSAFTTSVPLSTSATATSTTTSSSLLMLGGNNCNLISSPFVDKMTTLLPISSSSTLSPISTPVNVVGGGDGGDGGDQNMGHGFTNKQNNTNYFDSFDNYLDFSVQKILQKSNTAKDAEKQFECLTESSAAAASTPAEQQFPISSSQFTSLSTESSLSSSSSSAAATTAPAASVSPSVTEFSLETEVDDNLETIKPVELLNNEKLSHSMQLPQFSISSTLRETHIFTPSKGTTSVSREVNDALGTTGIAIDKNVVVKEYRDIEYNPDKLRVEDSNDFSEFTQFQSVPPIVNNLSDGILIPLKNESNRNITIDWPEPGIVDTMTVSENILENSSMRKEESNFTQFQLPDSPFKMTKSHEFSKPSIGISPTEEASSPSMSSVVESTPNMEVSTKKFVISNDNDDDEFSDFQSVAPTQNNSSFNPISLKSNISSSNLNLASSLPHSSQSKSADINYEPTKPIDMSSALNPLKPSILQPQTKATIIENKPKIAWPDPGIDPDELARIEAIFPQCKIRTENTIESPNIIQQNKNSSQEDDEWSDFVSGTVPFPSRHQLPQLSAPPKIAAQPILNQLHAKSTSKDEDDWSDFVSSTTTSSQITNKQSIMTGPNFSSWTTPQLPPPQFNSWHNTNIFQQSQFTSPIVFNSNNNNNAMNGIRSTGGNSMNVTQTSVTTGSQIPTLTRRSQPTTNISLIPDMSFAAPKTFINMPKSGFTKK